jgi:hypothetical protein
VLVQILGSDAVARRRRFAGKRNVALEHLIRITADLDAGAAAFEYLTAMRRSRPIALALLLVLMMTAAVMASTVSFALALSHHALEILVGHHPPLG